MTAPVVDVAVPEGPLHPQRSVATGRVRGTSLSLGLATLYLSLIVLIPLGAVVWRSRLRCR